MTQQCKTILNKYKSFQLRQRYYKALIKSVTLGNRKAISKIFDTSPQRIQYWLKKKNNPSFHNKSHGEK